LAVTLAAIAKALSDSHLVALKPIYGSSAPPGYTLPALVFFACLFAPRWIAWPAQLCAAGLLVAHPFPIYGTFFASQQAGPVYGPMLAQAVSTWPFVVLLLGPCTRDLLPRRPITRAVLATAIVLLPTHHLAPRLFTSQLVQVRISQNVAT
jgi:hypothetical protein